METGTKYQNHVSSMQKLNDFEGRTKYQAPFAQSFETIFAKANEADVKLDNANDFLHSLNTEELSTLQKYAGLADPINIDGLSREAAYNLLMHDDEKYDFNGDGMTQVGAANMGNILPSNMPADVQDAFIDAINSLDENDKMRSLMLLTLDTNLAVSRMTGKEYKPANFNYAYLSSRVDGILNPKNGAYSSEEIKVSIGKFWDAFENSFTGDKTQQEEGRDPAVQEFLDDLLTKGSMKFLSDFNKEKIEKKVEEFRNKLIEELGSSAEALVEIEQRVNEYRKQLLEELKNSIDNDDKKKTAIDTNVMVNMMLEMFEEQKNAKIKPLNELIQNI